MQACPAAMPLLMMEALREGTETDRSKETLIKSVLPKEMVAFAGGI